jgi:hypothetical protein
MRKSLNFIIRDYKQETKKFFKKLKMKKIFFSFNCLKINSINTKNNVPLYHTFADIFTAYIFLCCLFVDGQSMTNLVNVEYTFFFF